MPEFTLPDYPLQNISRDALKRDARWFCEDYRLRHPRIPVGGKTNSFLNKIESGDYWSMLAFIDGGYNDLDDYVDVYLCNRKPKTLRKKAQERKKQQAHAANLFSHDELQQLLELTVKFALVGDSGKPWPEPVDGHSVVFRHLVQKPDSIFRQAVTADYLRYLANGRLWEELPKMHTCLNFAISYERVADILLNYYDILDPQLSKVGYKLFRKNSKAYEKSSVGLLFDLSLLPSHIIDRYVDFVSQLDLQKRELGFTESDLELLVAPYAAELVATDSGGRQKFGNVQKRLTEPLVARYLKESDYVRNAVAYRLMLGTSFGQNKGESVEASLAMPVPAEMIQRFIGKSSTPYDLCKSLEPLFANYGVILAALSTRDL